jgi:hypothetical protein
MDKKAAGRPAEPIRRLPGLKPGKYADGLPLDELRYFECKIILKPNHFTSRQRLFDFAKIVRRPAEESGIGFDATGYLEEPLQIREVLFVDTADFRLYNNAFILRRRVPYRDGFPVGSPEIVFKFRHPDLQKAAQIDVRPNIDGDYRIKFKVEVLPLKEQLGGARLLYSHNVELHLTSMSSGDQLSMDKIVDVWPALASIKRSPDEKLDLVGGTIVEEVLQDIGEIDFGNGVRAVANVALWRSRGDHRPLVGEFAFQVKFKRSEKLNAINLDRGNRFFVALQQAARDWIQLGATKTGVVYRLKGNPPSAHE